MSNEFHAGIHRDRSDVMKKLINSVDSVTACARTLEQTRLRDAPVDSSALRWGR
jgi:hypothetical protein